MYMFLFLQVAKVTYARTWCGFNRPAVLPPSDWEAPTPRGESGCKLLCKYIVMSETGIFPDLVTVVRVPLRAKDSSRVPARAKAL
jgi:hypothetical protein